MQTATAALESVDSNSHELRSRLHYEMARCEMADDTLAKVFTHLFSVLQIEGSNTRTTSNKVSAVSHVPYVSFTAAF